MTRSVSYFINAEIFDPTPYESTEDCECGEEEHAWEILDGRVCPVCEKPMMSDEYITSITHPADTFGKVSVLVHSECMKDDALELLEKLGYTVVEDIGRDME